MPEIKEERWKLLARHPLMTNIGWEPLKDFDGVSFESQMKAQRAYCDIWDNLEAYSTDEVVAVPCTVKTTWDNPGKEDRVSA